MPLSPGAMDEKFPRFKRWETRSALRAFARSQKETLRRTPGAIIEAATDLAGEVGDFTIKQVADRAGVALDTVYRHFGSKDELVLAMLEEANTAGWLRAQAQGIEQPLERLRFMVTAPIVAEWTEKERRRLAFFGQERQRLMRTHPRETEAVLTPIRDLITDAITEARATGEIASDDIALDAELILHLLLTLTHIVVADGFEQAPQAIAERTWHLCYNALAAQSEEPRRPSSPIKPAGKTTHSRRNSPQATRHS